MAAGFKQATVNASDVPATLSNYPTYVDLSRLGITTQAEADSVRCYSDASKTTELAREIVSVSEMHVKIPSLTSTFTLYVDWDGTSSDYAVTDTYGRNAVWSDYESVLHMDESSGDAVDSTGNGDWSDTNTVGSITGQIEDGRHFTKANSERFVTTRNLTDGMAALTVQFWANPVSFAVPMFVWSFERQTNPNDAYNHWALFNTNGTIQFGIENDSGSRSIMNSISAFSTGTWSMAHTCWDGSNLRVFRNGSANGSTSHTATGYSDDSVQKFWGGNDAQSLRYLDSSLDECRVRKSYVGANWITTEYNNQSDEAGFWGTWSDVGGGPPVSTFTPKAIII